MKIVPALALVASAIALTSGCSSRSEREAQLLRRTPPLRVSERAFSVLLVGDAGEPVRNVAPIFNAIAREARDARDRTTVIVLGDNIYHSGLPPEGDPTRQESVERIEGQVLPLKASGSSALFIPGNHDWHEGSGGNGWETVKRQGEYVERIGGPEVRFRPIGGCPGPDIEDGLVRGLRVVVLDTQWWIQNGPKPQNPGSSCPAATDAEVQSALRSALVPDDGRPVIVVSHHPPISGGGHGGHFTKRDHLFPLRAWKGWMWLPLPVIGSLVPLYRSLGGYPQDTPAAVYEHMLSVINPVLREHPPLAWAAGHEHGIQILNGDGLAKRLIVSGAGAFHHTRPPVWLATTNFASGEPGFVRLDMSLRGTGRIAALTVKDDSQTVERYSERID